MLLLGGKDWSLQFGTPVRIYLVLMLVKDWGSYTSKLYKIHFLFCAYFPYLPHLNSFLCRFHCFSKFKWYGSLVEYGQNVFPVEGISFISLTQKVDISNSFKTEVHELNCKYATWCYLWVRGFFLSFIFSWDPLCMSWCLHVN